MRSSRLALLACVLVPLAACGKEGGGLLGGGSSAAGTYTLDVGETTKRVDAAIKKQLEKMPPEQRAMAEPMMRQMKDMYAKMKFEIVLEGNGTARATFQQPGETAEPGVGTWKQDGSKVTLTMREPDEAEAEAETISGTYDDGVLVLTMAQDQGEMVLRKR